MLIPPGLLCMRFSSCASDVATCVIYMCVTCTCVRTSTQKPRPCICQKRGLSTHSTSHLLPGEGAQATGCAVARTCITSFTQCIPAWPSLMPSTLSSSSALAAIYSSAGHSRTTAATHRQSINASHVLHGAHVARQPCCRAPVFAPHSTAPATCMATATMPCCQPSTMLSPARILSISRIMCRTTHVTGEWQRLGASLVQNCHEVS